MISIGFAVFSPVETRLSLRASDAGFFIFVPICSSNVVCLFAFGAFVKGFNKKYRILFYDSSLEAVLAKAGHVCVVVFSRAGFHSGGLRRPVAVLEQKRALKLRNVVDKSRAAPRAPRICDNGAVRRKQYVAVLQ